MLVFKIIHISMLSVPVAFEKRIKLEEPTRFCDLLSLHKEWSGQYNHGWDIFLDSDKFVMKGLTTSTVKPLGRLY